MSPESESPWRRLPWTLPSALVTGIFLLWLLAYFTGKASVRLPDPPAVDAQLVEIPAPKIDVPAEIKKQATPPIIPSTPIRPPSIQSAMTDQQNIKKSPLPVQEQKPVAETRSAPPPSTPIAVPVREATSTSLTGNSGAQAIVKPMPQIPDELRQDALSASAVARFHVAIDGTAMVELIKPTPNPKLNRLLLDTLKNWRFFPSMKDGKPVASTQEIVIKIEVK